MKGSYVLVIELKNKTVIDIGKLGKIHFGKGNYVYIGSALNSLDKRIQRHYRNKKKLHWHIDYLLEKAIIIDVFFKYTDIREECYIAYKFNELKPILGFGCSDCKCISHLYFGTNTEIMKIIEDLELIDFHDFF